MWHVFIFLDFPRLTKRTKLEQNISVVLKTLQPKIARDN